MKPIRRTLSGWIIQQANKRRRAETLEDIPADPETGEEHVPEEPEEDPE